MAFAKTLTIGTGTMVPELPQAQSVSVTITYEIERGDADLLALAGEKAEELEAVRTTVLRSMQTTLQDQAIEVGSTDETAKGPSTVSGRDQRRRPRKADAAAQPADEPKADLAGATAESTVPPKEPSGSGQPEGQAEHGNLQAYEPVMNVQKIAIRSLAARKGHTPDSLAHALTQAYGKASIDDLTKGEAKEFLATFQRDETYPAAQAA